jgi:hypothetical protein
MPHVKKPPQFGSTDACPARKSAMARHVGNEQQRNKEQNPAKWWHKTVRFLSPLTRGETPCERPNRTKLLELPVFVHVRTDGMKAAL